MKKSYLIERFRELHYDFQKQINIADIWDRLAAFVLDFFFLVLMTNLLFAPIKKKLEIAVLNEHDGAAQIYFWLLMIGFCTLFVFYHTLCIFFFKKTIGKKVFSIEVRSILQGVDLSLGNCILRSFAQLFSIVLVGFPFLQIFSHKMRRPIHDRISDSITCSLRKKGTTPDFIEKLWVKVIYMVLLINLLLIGFASLYFVKADMSDITDFVTEPEFLCDDVSEAKDSWNSSSTKMSRLDVALTLFGAGEINKECLEVEAEKFLSFEQDLDKAYLAKAFAHEDHAQISNNYLKKVCEVSQNSESCLLTKMISAWSDKKWDTVDHLLEKHEHVQSPFFVVWIIQHYDREQNYEKVIELVEDLSPNKALSNFIGKYKSIALWNLDHKNEAEELFETTYTNMSKDSQSAYLADMCRLEAESNCSGAQSKACQWLSDQKPRQDDEYQPKVLLSLVKSEKCGYTKIDDIISKYRNIVDDTRMQLFLAANKAEVSGKKLVAEQIYKNLLDSADEDPYFHYEVHSHLLDLANDKKDYEAQVSWWLSAEAINSYHFAMGEKILKNLMQNKMWDLALKISQKMMTRSFLPQDLQKQLVVVLYKNNKFVLAQKIIQKIEIAEQDSQKRGVASLDEYKQAKAALEGKRDK